MEASILSIGTELMTGLIADTNAQFVSQKLANAGYSVKAHYAVGDHLDEISHVLQTIPTPINIISGGLGPTFDDLTRKAAAQAFQTEIEFKEELWKEIQKYYPNISENNKIQAYLPKGAFSLVNPIGTAPGFRIHAHNKDYFFLPGVPKELKKMYQEQVYPFILKNYPLKENIKSIYYKVAALPEAEVSQKLKPLLQEKKLSRSGIYANEGIITIKLTATDNNITTANTLLEQQEPQLVKIFGNHLFEKGNRSLPEVVLSLLIERKETLATAESCTGGLIGSELTNVSGASNAYLAGMIVYSNEAKQKQLGVKKDTLERFGAVSEETAKEMALGAREKAETTYAISITGIAGPAGGTPEKPVGTVCIGISSPTKTTTYRHRYPGNRDSVRKRSLTMALFLLRNTILENKSEKALSV